MYCSLKQETKYSQTATHPLPQKSMFYNKKDLVLALMQRTVKYKEKSKKVYIWTLNPV